MHSGTMRGTVGTLALLIAGWTGLARAGEARVVAIYPVSPVREGASSVELGFELSGDASQLAVSVKGSSAAFGPFADVPRAVVNRDQAGLLAYHLLVAIGGFIISQARRGRRYLS